MTQITENGTAKTEFEVKEDTMVVKTFQLTTDMIKSSSSKAYT